MSTLLASAFEPTTVKQYKHAWDNFSKFVNVTLGTQLILPLDGKTVGLYVSHLHSLGLQSSTIRTHLSAISYYHKIRDVYDPTQCFLVNKLMASVQKQAQSVDQRLPVSHSLLQKLIQALHSVASNQGDIYLYSAMFSLAYYACLRIGEVAVSTNTRNTLSIHQITKVFKKGSVCAIRVYFERFKHSNSETPVLEIPKQSDTTCPVFHLERYVAIRPINNINTLFLTSQGSPVTRAKFLAIFHKCISYHSLDTSRYNTHSFWIGRCTDLVLQGFSNDKIKKIGRWKSNAYLRYVRPDVITT